MTRIAASQLARHNINVNAVCPGATRTDLFEQVVGEMIEREGISRDRALERLDRSIPLRRSNEPSDIANLEMDLNQVMPNGQTVIYLNRLSDLLFVAARYQTTQSGNTDLLWDSHGY